MIGTIYANSVSDSERTGKSAVHRSFRNLGKSVEYDGDTVDIASRISPQGIHRTSASSPRNQLSSAARSQHSSGSCSPADTSTRAKNLTPFSRRERRLGENRSPAALTEEQVVNELHKGHHLSSSSDRLSAASADEEVFLARVRKSVSPSQKLSDGASQSGVGPSRIRIRSKESISSGAHGCDHRTNVESPLDHREKVHSDSDRGPRESSFTGSVRLTLKQKSEDLTDDGGPQKIRTFSTRTNSSTDEFPGVIRAQSKAVSYESICLKIKEESTDNPKTIQVISLSQPSYLVSTPRAVLLEETETNNCSPENCRSPPCSASQLCDVQSREVISSRPAQRDHSTKHRSTVFFSSKKSASGSHTNLNQIESASLFPIQISKVSSLPAKLIQQNAGEGNRKSYLGQPSKISELHDQNRSGKVITLNKECHDVTLHTSTQTFTKSEDPQIIGETEYGATSDKRLLKMEPTEQLSSYFDMSPNRPGKESKFFLKSDQQPKSNSQLIMGTVFTDRHNLRQNLLFPGADIVQRDNSGRTSDTKASQSSKVSAYKIIKQTSRPVVEESQTSVVAENKVGVLVREAKHSADGPAQIAAAFSKDSGSRVIRIQPVAKTQDNNKFSSSFLCSLSKFSHPPEEGISLSASRPRPISISSSSSSSSSLSRVGWAKQRLGQDPENKSSGTAISQLKTSLIDSAPLGIHQLGSVYPQIHNTGVTIASTSKQDRANCVEGKHTIMVARRELPSVGDSSLATVPLPVLVTAPDVTVSPLVLGPVKSTSALSPALQFTASKKLLQTSTPLVAERQNPAITGNLGTGSLKVFMQSTQPAAVLKRTSLLVPYVSAPLYDINDSQSSVSLDSANSTDISFPELEVEFYGGAESTDSFLKLDYDSTGLVETASPSAVFENTVVRAFVCEPPITDVCALVQEIVPTVIVESVTPHDDKVLVLPIDSIACQQHLLLDTTVSDIVSKPAQSEASPKHSSQASVQSELFVSNRGLSSNNGAFGKANKFGQVTEDPPKVICPYNEGSGEKTLEESGEPYKIKISPSDSLDSELEPDGLQTASTKSEDSQTEEEVSPNEYGNSQQSLSDSYSPDTSIQVPGRGLCSTAQIDAVHVHNVIDSEDKLSQLDRNPESFEPSSDASEVTNGPWVTTSHDDHQVEDSSESTTGTSRTQGPSSQRQPERDLDSEIEISSSRNLAMTKDNRGGCDGINESLRVSTKDTEDQSVLSEDKRTDQNVKPEAEVVRGRLAKTRSIPSLEIIEENSTTTKISSTKPTSSTNTSVTATIILAKKALNTDTVSQGGPSSRTDNGGNLLQTSAIDTVQKDSLEECRDTSEQSLLPETVKTDLGTVGPTKKTSEKAKTRRFVRFESQEEMMEFSPKEFSASGAGCTPSDVPAEKPCPPLNSSEPDALGASATVTKPAVILSPDEPFLGDFHLKVSIKDPETFEELLLKSPRKDSDTSRDDPSKTSPSAGKTMGKPSIVRKQLIHLDSALHPSSCVPPESKPVEARWSPKLVRKLNLAEAKDVDVSDLDVSPDLMDFLSKEIQKVSPDIKQPATHREAKDELETGIHGIPSLSVQRKPPLSLPLKPTERDEEEDALPPSTSAADNDPVKPEVAEVGKRKFFSALKANAASFRAKKVPSCDDSSPDKSHLDRLASFAMISDVGIGTKRRQFQQHKETSSLSTSNDPTTDAHAKPLTLESPPSTARLQKKDPSFPIQSSSGANVDKTKTRLGRDDESETRLGADNEMKTRLGRPEVVDSDDDFDKLVEINFRQLVDEKSGAAVGVPAASMEQRKGAKNLTGTGLAGMSGIAGVSGGQQKIQGSRRQISRFKTQPVTTVEVEKAREMALHQTKAEN